MRGTVAKRLRKEAVLMTVGQPEGLTKQVYKILKKGYKR